MKDQKILEKKGVYKSKMFTNANIEWLKERLVGFNEMELLEKNNRYNEVFNKLLSKVEYRCINCSPAYFRIFSCNNSDLNCEPSLSDEFENYSLTMYVPLLEKGERVVFSTFTEFIDIRSHPRGENIRNIYSGKNWLKKYTKDIILEQGDAIISFSHLPYFINSSNSIVWISVGILPYEVKSIQYKGDKSGIHQYLMEEFDWYAYWHDKSKYVPRKFRKFDDSKLHHTEISELMFKKNIINYRVSEILKSILSFFKKN